MSPGRRERSAARAAAVVVARRLGCPGEQLRRQVHGSTSDVFVAGPWVFIVAKASAVEADLVARVAAATVLSQRAAFVRPADGIDQPQRAAGRLVTVWHRVSPSPDPPDWTAVGRAVRSLHDVDPAAVAATGLALGRLHGMGDVLAQLNQLASAGRISRRHLDVLRRAAQRLDDELAPLEGPVALVHGDLHGGNLLHSSAGAVICDLDELAAAHPVYDLAFLVDPGRPTIPSTPQARAAFSRGYDAQLPAPEMARSVARSAHLRRTVRLLASGTRKPRARYFDLARLGAWDAVLDHWGTDLHPIVVHSRARQLSWAVRGTAAGVQFRQCSLSGRRA